MTTTDLRGEGDFRQQLIDALVVRLGEPQRQRIEAAVGKLDEESLLSPEGLRLATSDEIKVLGINTGITGAIKALYPSAAAPATGGKVEVTVEVDEVTGQRYVPTAMDQYLAGVAPLPDFGFDVWGSDIDTKVIAAYANNYRGTVFFAAAGEQGLTRDPDAIYGRFPGIDPDAGQALYDWIIEFNRDYPESAIVQAIGKTPAMGSHWASALRTAAEIANVRTTSRLAGPGATFTTNSVSSSWPTVGRDWRAVGERMTEVLTSSSALYASRGLNQRLDSLLEILALPGIAGALPGNVKPQNRIVFIIKQLSGIDLRHVMQLAQVTRELMMAIPYMPVDIDQAGDEILLPVGRRSNNYLWLYDAVFGGGAATAAPDFRSAQPAPAPQQKQRRIVRVRLGVDFSVSW